MIEDFVVEGRGPGRVGGNDAPVCARNGCPSDQRDAVLDFLADEFVIGVEEEVTRVAYSGPICDLGGDAAHALVKLVIDKLRVVSAWIDTADLVADRVVFVGGREGGIDGIDDAFLE